MVRANTNKKTKKALTKGLFLLFTPEKKKFTVIGPGRKKLRKARPKDLNLKGENE